jgi:hypothetical protein
LSEPSLDLLAVARNPTAWPASEVRRFIDTYWPNHRVTLQDLGDDGPRLLVEMFQYAGSTAK